MPNFEPPGEENYLVRVRGQARSNDQVDIYTRQTVPHAMGPYDQLIGRCQQLFIYMDVGCWIQGNKTFGVIYGDSAHDRYGHVVLCRYNTNASQVSRSLGVLRQGRNPLDTVLANFLRHTNGEVVRRTMADGLHTDGKIIVLLGDLHLPVAGPGCRELPTGRVRGRLRDRIQIINFDTLRVTATEGILAGLGRAAQRDITDRNFLQTYYQADIFGNAGASLQTWLNSLESWCRTASNAPLHLVQVGDLYEMWIGLARLFRAREQLSQQDRNRRRIMLDIPRDTNLGTFNTTLTRVDEGSAPARNLAVQTIEDWGLRTDRTTQVRVGGNNRSLTSRLFARPGRESRIQQKTFLIGNHDCYVKPLCGRGAMGLQVSPDVSQPQANQIPLPQILMNRYVHGIHMEHGHENDPYNMPAEVSGWEITQFAFVADWARGAQGAFYAFKERYDLLESERKAHLKYSVRKFVMHNRQMKVFAMAHTHAPFLTTMCVLP